MLALLGSASAQKYDHGVGVRVDKFQTALSYKYIFNTSRNAAVELTAGWQHNYTTGFPVVGLMLEKQRSVFNSQLQVGLDMVIGGGCYVGYYANGFNSPGMMNVGANNKFNAGFQAVAGLEYEVTFIPITIGLELNPRYDFYNKGQELFNISIPIRLVRY